jgi:hypothetical protein
MRPLALVRVAAEAEGLRLRNMMQRMVVRLAAGVVGLLFVLAAAAWAHVAIWYWLRLDFGWVQYAAAGALAGVDLVIALICVVLAARSSPSKAEQEAVAIRKRALTSALSTMAAATVLLPLLRSVLAMTRRARREG